MSSGFSSSGSSSNQAKEGTEDIEGSEFATGGNYSPGMSSSGTVNNQADSDCKNEDDVGGLHRNPNLIIKITQQNK
jgi:hypothetical protein